MPRLPTALLALAVLCVLPAGANAAWAGSDQIEGDDVVFAADAGETNRLTVTGQPGGGVVFEDSGASITPGRGCTSLAANRVSCARGVFVTVVLEDGDDQVTTNGDWIDRTPIFIEGGQGNDLIDGRVGVTFIDGNTGTDRLIGGNATRRIDAVDAVRQGEFQDLPDHNRERDEVTCAAPEAPSETRIDVDANDVVDGPCPPRSVFLENFILMEGTPGDDLLTAPGPPARVFGLEGTDSLFSDSNDRSDGGEGNDRLSGQGLMLGGSGDDSFSLGFPRARADGQSGDDRIEGSSGADTIAGGTGRDRISARSGNDTIRVKDGARDSVSCGGGSRDRVSADRGDTISRDCEVVSRG
jgi:Ca2+-binding RTX toxin-like protein